MSVNGPLKQVMSCISVPSNSKWKDTYAKLLAHAMKTYTENYTARTHQEHRTCWISCSWWFKMTALPSEVAKSNLFYYWIICGFGDERLTSSIKSINEEEDEEEKESYFNAYSSKETEIDRWKCLFCENNRITILLRNQIKKNWKWLTYYFV